MGALGFVIGMLILWIYLLEDVVKDIISCLLYSGGNQKPKTIWVSSKLTPEQKEKIISETEEREKWGDAIDTHYNNNVYYYKAHAKYWYPDKEMEKSVNLEYFTGYRGYYNPYRMHYMPGDSYPDTVKFLDIIETEIRKNPEYYTPAYYYHYQAKKDDDIMALLGVRMTKKEFNEELKKRQYQIGFYADYKRIGIHSEPCHYYNECSFDKDTASLDFIERARRFNSECIESMKIPIDVRDRIKAYKVPKFLYDEDYTMYINVRLYGDTYIYYYHDIPIADYIEVEIESIDLQISSEYLNIDSRDESKCIDLKHLASKRALLKEKKEVRESKLV